MASQLCISCNDSRRTFEKRYDKLNATTIVTPREILVVPMPGTKSRSDRHVNFWFFFGLRRLGIVAVSISLPSCSRDPLGFVVVLVFVDSAWSLFRFSCHVGLGSVSVSSPSSFLLSSWLL